MLCEGSLWLVAVSSISEGTDVDPPPSGSTAALTSPQSLTTTFSAQTLPPLPSSPTQHSPTSRDAQTPPETLLDCPRQLSPGVGIPGRSDPPGVETFLVPSSCHSICQHYSDLHIAGGQVLPLSPSAVDQEGGALQDTQPGPFLLSGDVPLPSLLPPLLPETKSSRQWREGSGRERPSLLQGGQPLSNSQLNGYLEQKLLELYREYLTEGPAGPRPVMASELLQCSLEQITLQLSRDQKLETAQAKDMLLSCLLRATSDLQSSEISTPLLQISTQTK